MTVYGWIGGGLSVVYNIPQIFKIYRTKQISGVSHSSLLLRMVSYVLVIYHSSMRHDQAIMYTTLVGLGQLILIYTQLLLYKETAVHETDPQPVSIEPT